ncbi:MAG: leucine-rich repeat protein [Clostridiales bacterium]|jgi:uncharacterized repeat protein (TIGR02543 family)|nr:leucine-rich repeat protein [Clostridiales bacterium]
MKKRFVTILLIISAVCLTFALSGCWLFDNPAKEVTYRVTFVYGNGAPDSVVGFKPGETVSPPNPVKEGHVFDAWYKDAEFTVKFDPNGEDARVRGDMTLYAKYKKLHSIHASVRDYVTNDVVPDGYVSGTGEYADGSEFTLTVSVPEGRVFEGWYLGGERLSGGVSLTDAARGDAEYTAKTKRGLYIRAEIGPGPVGGAVKINGEERGTLTLLEGESAEVEAEIEPGYRFDGWYMNGALHTAEPRFETALYGNLIFEARFSYIYYTATVETPFSERGSAELSGDNNGGAGYLVGDAVTVSASPAENYILESLSLKNGGGYIFLSSSPVSTFGVAELIELTGGGTETFEFLAEFVSADTSAGFYSYETISGGVAARITGVTTAFSTGAVYVPAYIDGLPVTEIAAGAFYGRSDVTAVYLPSSLTAFSGSGNPFALCVNLVSVTAAEDSAFLTADGVLYGKNGVSLISYPCAKNAESYTAPASVQRIEESAFEGQRFLKSFTADGALKYIGRFAFANCAELTSFSSVSAPASFETGTFVFLNCKKLTSASVILTKNVTGASMIGAYAFSGCERLENAEFKGIKTLNEGMFAGCPSLVEITLPAALATVSGDVFGGSGLTAIYTAENSGTFTSRNGILYRDKLLYRCPEKYAGVVSVYEGTNSIADNSFKNCAAVTAVYLPNSVLVIGIQAFYNASSLSVFDMGDSVVQIKEYAFYGCAALVRLTVSPALETVGEFVFSGTGITRLDMGESLTTAAATAFYEMARLVSITFPNTVTDLGDRFNGADGETPLFYGCFTLEEIIVTGGSASSVYYTPQSGGDAGILYKNDDYLKEMVALCPAGKTGSVTLTSNHLFKIASGAFMNSKISAIYFDFEGVAPTLLSIGHDAFAYAENLQAVVIPASVTAIGDNAFLGCSSLAEVTLSEDLKRIGYFAFSDCAIEEIIIPASVTNIYALAFYGNANLKRVYFRSATPPSVTFFNANTLIFGLHNADFSIYIAATKNVIPGDSGKPDTVTWSSNISAYKNNNWKEYNAYYKDWFYE